MYASELTDRHANDIYDSYITNHKYSVGVLCTKFRRQGIEAIFTGKDLKANTTRSTNICKRWTWYATGVGILIYDLFHHEIFVPANHIGTVNFLSARLHLRYDNIATSSISLHGHNFIRRRPDYG